MLQIKLFTIPVSKPEDGEELNKFLRSVKVLETIQDVVSSPHGSYWCFCIKYFEDGTTIYQHKDKVDYKSVLSPEHFAVFSKLREWRKEASKASGLPAYAIFTDEELSKIAALKEITAAGIKSIKGIGDKKTELYASSIVQLFINNEDAKES